MDQYRWFREQLPGAKLRRLDCNSNFWDQE